MYLYLPGLPLKNTSTDFLKREMNRGASRATNRLVLFWSGADAQSLAYEQISGLVRGSTGTDVYGPSRRVLSNKEWPGEPALRYPPRSLLSQHHGPREPGREQSV